MYDDTSCDTFNTLAYMVGLYILHTDEPFL